MKIDKINSALNFNGLNIKKVAHEHRHFVRANLGEFKKLGEQYDITMESVIGSEQRCDGIKIIVKNLRKDLGFWKKFNRPKGESYFYTERHYDTDKNPTILEQTNNAINELVK